MQLILGFSNCIPTLTVIWFYSTYIHIYFRCINLRIGARVCPLACPLLPYTLIHNLQHQPDILVKLKKAITTHLWTLTDFILWNPGFDLLAAADRSILVSGSCPCIIDSLYNLLWNTSAIAQYLLPLYTDLVTPPLNLLLWHRCWLFVDFFETAPFWTCLFWKTTICDKVRWGLPKFIKNPHRTV